MNIYKTFDIVVVPFPFADTKDVKNRPAIVISNYVSFNKNAGHSILAMITSSKHQQWPLDIDIEDLLSCGLEKSSIIRFKLFTLDHTLIKAKIGSLRGKDREKLKQALKIIFKE